MFRKGSFHWTVSCCIDELSDHVWTSSSSSSLHALKPTHPVSLLFILNSLTSFFATHGRRQGSRPFHPTFAFSILLVSDLIFSSSFRLSIRVSETTLSEARLWTMVGDNDQYVCVSCARIETQFAIHRSTSVGGSLIVFRQESFRSRWSGLFNVTSAMLSNCSSKCFPVKRGITESAWISSGSVRDVFLVSPNKNEEVDVSSLLRKWRSVV